METGWGSEGKAELPSAWALVSADSGDLLSQDCLAELFRTRGIPLLITIGHKLSGREPTLGKSPSQAILVGG